MRHLPPPATAAVQLDLWNELQQCEYVLRYTISPKNYAFLQVLAKPAAHTATCVQRHLHPSPDHLLHLSNTQLAIVFNFLCGSS